MKSNPNLDVGPQHVARGAGDPEHGTAVMLLRVEEDEISVYLSKRVHCRGGNGLWQLAGGGIEIGETPLQAAMREVLEETGLQIPEWRMLYWGHESTPGSVEGMGEFPIYCFAVILFDEETPRNTEPEKHGDWEPVPRDEVLSRAIMPGIRTETFRRVFIGLGL